MEYLTKNDTMIQQNKHDILTNMKRNIFCGLLGVVIVCSIIFNIYALMHLIWQRSRKFIHLIMASLFVSNTIPAAIGYPMDILAMLKVRPQVLMSHPFIQLRAYTVFSASAISIEHVLCYSVCTDSSNLHVHITHE